MSRAEAEPGTPFVFLHVGDQHVTALGSHNRILAAREARLEADLSAIVEDIGSVTAGRDAIRFVYLPGGLAENAGADEYAKLARQLARVGDIPVRLIPGDHDRALGTMENFASFRAAVGGGLPPPAEACTQTDMPLQGYPPRQVQPQRGLRQFFFAEDFRTTRGEEIRCIFLDTVSAGHGRKGWGLDFRLGSGQFAWLADRLRECRGRIDTSKESSTTVGRKRALVFMHCYPADFHERDEADELAGLLWNEDVRIVEMGHTHYNEVGHDGRTMWATARSVGQNEDGPAGYAVVALDGDVTSWRFRQAQQTWPFVTITSPADRRLARGPLERRADGTITVRALMLSDRPVAEDACFCRVDLGAWQDMTPVGSTGVFTCNVPWTDGSRSIQVKAVSNAYEFGKDLIDFDTIEPATSDEAAFVTRSKPEAAGGDGLAIGSWPEKGVRGDQLGPNKRGRKW